MIYLFGAYYLAAFAAGAALAVLLFRQCRDAVAFVEMIVIYCVLSLFLVLGLFVIYTQAHYRGNALLGSAQLSVAVLLMGVLSYTLPRYHRLRFGLSFERVHQRLFGFLMLVAYACALMVWITDTDERLLLIAVAIADLFFAVGYSQIVYSKFAKRQREQHQRLVKAAILPVLAFAVALLEGIFYPQLSVIYGVTIALPFIFIAASVTVWIFRESLCPLQRQG